MRWLMRFSARLLRVVSLVLLAAIGSTLLMRYAPGYLADGRELDAAHADAARAELRQRQANEGTLPRLLARQGSSWLHGDLGQSRHYDVPVSLLVKERSAPTLRLLGSGMALGWCLAMAFAVPLSMGRRSRGELLVMITTATLMAVPVGVLATFSLLLKRVDPC